MTDLSLTPFDAPAFAGRHIGAAGLIGVDMLEDRRLLIDFRAEKIDILPSRRRARPLIRDRDAIVVSARNSAGRLILSDARIRSEEHTSELQSLMRISYAVFCLKKKKYTHTHPLNNP